MKPDDPMSTTETPSGTQPSVTSPRRRHEDFSRTREGAYHLRGANDFEAVIEFLRAIDPSELSDEEYTAIEEVILQAIVSHHIRRESAHRFRPVLGEVEHARRDQNRLVEELRSHVYNAVTGRPGAHRGRRVSCSHSLSCLDDLGTR